MTFFDQKECSIENVKFKPMTCCCFPACKSILSHPPPNQPTVSFHDVMCDASFSHIRHYTRATMHPNSSNSHFMSPASKPRTQATTCSSHCSCPRTRSRSFSRPSRRKVRKEKRRHRNRTENRRKKARNNTCRSTPRSMANHRQRCPRKSRTKSIPRTILKRITTIISTLVAAASAAASSTSTDHHRHRHPQASEPATGTPRNRPHSACNGPAHPATTVPTLNRAIRTTTIRTCT